MTRSHRRNKHKPPSVVPQRHPLLWTLLFGLGLVTLGIAVTVWISFVHGDDVQWIAFIHRSANTLVVAGVGVVIYAGLRAKGRSIEEAYRLGYDVGFENGFRAGVESTEDDGDNGGGREHAAVRHLRRVE